MVTDLIGELANARSQNGIHLHAPHQVRVAGDDVTQLQPHLVLRLALQAPEGVIIHHLCQLCRCFSPAELQHTGAGQLPAFRRPHVTSFCRCNTQYGMLASSLKRVSLPLQVLPLLQPS